MLSMRTKKLEKYEPLFNSLGYKLEKFKGFYGIGYYHIKESDYKKGYSDWLYSLDLDITLELLRLEQESNV